MQHAHDAYLVSHDTVRNDIVQVRDDKLTRPCLAPGPTYVGIIAEHLNRGPYALHHAYRSVRIVFRDVGVDAVNVALRGPLVEDPHG